MVRSTRLRQVLLAGTGLFYAGVAGVALVRPHTLAESFGYVLDSPLALGEFRAVYLGLWASQAGLCAAAAADAHRPILGTVVAALMLGLAFGRLVSLGIDGWPGPGVIVVLVSELVVGVALLAIRPTGGDVSVLPDT